MIATATNLRTITTRKGRSVESDLTDSQAIAALVDLPGQFAADLFARRNRLSAEQVAWAHVLVIESRQPREQRETSIGDMTRILELFAAAGERLKYPKISLHAADGNEIVLSVAGARSKAPGTVNVAGSRTYGGQWFGRIRLDGTFERARACTDAVVDRLREFAADPARVAGEHGHTTGACCFCCQALTDDRSLAVGYGPVCAKNYQLPWGARNA